MSESFLSFVLLCEVHIQVQGVMIDKKRKGRINSGRALRKKYFILHILQFNKSFSDNIRRIGRLITNVSIGQFSIIVLNNELPFTYCMKFEPIVSLLHIYANNTNYITITNHVSTQIYDHNERQQERIYFIIQSYHCLAFIHNHTLLITSHQN